MQNTKLIFSFLILFFALTFNACKKDSSTNKVLSTSQTNVASFSQLEVGNYWIYQRFDVDSAGNSTPLNKFDSCFIKGDTIINNYIYYKMFRPNTYSTSLPYLVNYLRDSSSYIIDFHHNIQFSSKDFNLIFRSGYQFYSNPLDTVNYYVTKMEEINQTTSTPSGSYVTLDARTTFQVWPSYSSGGSVRYMHCKYANNVGIVKESLPFYLTTQLQTERRLIRYHLN